MIQSLGKFKVIAYQAIDLASVMTAESAARLQSMRAQQLPVFASVQDASRHTWPSGVGSFRNYARDEANIEERHRLEYARHNKVVLSYAYLSRVTPEVYLESPGMSLTSVAPHALIGETISLAELAGDAAKRAEISYRRSALTVYADGILVFSFEFGADSLSTDEMVDLLGSMPHLTQIAAGQKLGLILNDPSFLAAAGDGKKFDLDVLAIAEPTIAFRRFGCGHILTLAQEMLDESGRPVPFEVMSLDPALTAILRRNSAALRYREAEIHNIASLCFANKSDELYVTLRGTTMVVVPGYWDPTSFLSLYVEDLVSLFSFTVSRITLIDYMSHATGPHVIADGGESTQALVADILLLRRLLLLVEESLDVDLWVNHYFTRQVIQSLQDQRGLPNKLDALRRRLDGLNGILSVRMQQRVSGESLSATVRQVRWGIAAVVASTLLNSIAVLVGILSLTSAG